MNKATLEVCVALLLICLVPVLGLAYYFKIRNDDDVRMYAEFQRMDAELEERLKGMRSGPTREKKAQ